jgi:hypothetical protein
MIRITSSKWFYNFDVEFQILGKPYQESISQTISKTRAIKQFGKLEFV